MNIIPWGNKRRSQDIRPINGGSPLAQIRAEMDRMFDRFLEGPWFGSGDGDYGALSSWMPALDLSETDKEITIRAEVPGVDPKDLKVEVVGNILTLSGEKSEQREHKGETYYHSERRFGSFRRQIELPAGANADKITAEHRSGVVTIRMPKTESAQTKRITVKVN